MNADKDLLEAKEDSASRTDVQEYLTFSLGEEQYALDIMSVKEIRGYEAVTRIANAPSFIKGVINLRGEIVPIVDLRIKFGVGEARYDEFTIVIVIQIHDRLVGIVVDAVSDVVSLSEQERRPPPEFGVAFDSRFLVGLAKLQNKMIILVDIEALVSSNELSLVDSEKEVSDEN
ncbi:chemotaxis protein CheW [Marinobacter sp. NSM]|uniref:chemotaxis protein CheW n=1 Tax=Marinobacter sp. NSM TaxID=3458004 RepID=UPI0040356EAC